MGILGRIKRRELEGFKEFVTSLETTGESRRKEIIQVAVLEDPLYMSWVIKNIHTATDVLKLSTDQVEKILKALPNGVGVLARAFYNRPEVEFIRNQGLSRYTLGEFNDILAGIKDLKKSDQEAAQFLIMKVMRNLQMRDEIYGLTWLLPPVELMHDDKMKSFTGPVLIKFDNGQTAAKGSMIKNLREGEWHHYFENGRIMARGEYDQGQKSGLWTFWYVNGNTKAQGPFKNDSKHGTWKEYDSEGKESIVEFEEGKRL